MTCFIFALSHSCIWLYIILVVSFLHFRIDSWKLESFWRNLFLFLENWPFFSVSQWRVQFGPYIKTPEESKHQASIWNINSKLIFSRTNSASSSVHSSSQVPVTGYGMISIENSQQFPANIYLLRSINWLFPLTWLVLCFCYNIS